MLVGGWGVLSQGRPMLVFEPHMAAKCAHVGSIRAAAFEAPDRANEILCASIGRFLQLVIPARGVSLSRSYVQNAHTLIPWLFEVGKHLSARDFDRWALVRVTSLPKALPPPNQ